MTLVPGWSGTHRSALARPLMASIKGVCSHPSLGKVFITSIPAALMGISHLVPSMGFCLWVYECLLSPLSMSPQPLPLTLLRQCTFSIGPCVVPLCVSCPLTPGSFLNALQLFCSHFAGGGEIESTQAYCPIPS